MILHDFKQTKKKKERKKIFTQIRKIGLVRHVKQFFFFFFFCGLSSKLMQKEKKEKKRKVKFYPNFENLSSGNH